MGTAKGRWVVAAAVLGSGVAFLDGTVVNAALPAISRDLHADLGDLQWVLTGYLLTLGSLLVLGGSLGDRYGRRKIFVIGLVAFAATSLLCAIAPDTGTLIAARCVQGVAAALLVPNSLAMVSASFARRDRGRAIGAWSGLGGIADRASARSSAATSSTRCRGDGCSSSTCRSRRRDRDRAAPRARVARRARRRAPRRRRSALLTVGLAGVVYALIEGPGRDWTALDVGVGVVGVVALAAFLLVEARIAEPDGAARRSSGREQFSGANAVTFAVYAALGTVTFLLVVHLQTDLGYSALEAGASLLPITVCMVLFSARAGALAQRIGPRLADDDRAPGRRRSAWRSSDASSPAPLLGRRCSRRSSCSVSASSLTVAPLTATVLGAVEDRTRASRRRSTTRSARIAGLLAVAVLPAAAGLTAAQGLDLDAGFARAMYIAAVLAAVGGVLAFFTIRRAVFVAPVVQANPATPCYGSEADVAGSAA